MLAIVLCCVAFIGVAAAWDPNNDASHPAVQYLNNHYVETIQRLGFEHVKQPKDSIRYVVYESSNLGLGNKLLALVANFVVALITERAYAVAWPVDAIENELFTLGRNLRYPIDGHDLLWNAQVSDTHLNKLNADELEHSFEELLCSNLTAIPERLLVMQGWSYYISLLKQNPHHADLLAQLFPDGDVFGPIFRWLVTPTSSVQHRIDQLVSNITDLHNRSGAVIGLQIRGHGGKDSYIDSDGELALLACAKHLAAERRGQGHTMFFLSSDTPSSRERAVSALGEDNVLVAAGLDELAVDPQRSTAGEWRLRALQSALVDMFVLGEADDTIYSPDSTFGFVAAGRVSRAALTLVDNAGSVGRSAPICVRSITSEPFCHACTARELYERSYCYDRETTTTEEFLAMDTQGAYVIRAFRALYDIYRSSLRVADALLGRMVGQEGRNASVTSPPLVLLASCSLACILCIFFKRRKRKATDATTTASVEASSHDKVV